MTKFILCEIEGGKKKFVIKEQFERGFGENLKDRKSWKQLSIAVGCTL